MTASVTTIASFPTSPSNGTEPDGQLFIASNGDLLGATVSGGADGAGTTYEIVNTGGGFASTPTFLADVPSALNTLLGVPNLSADASGDLFGLELSGGATGHGAVVEFPAAGGSPNTLASFAGGAGGANPGGKLLVDASGNLFGTTASGGSNGSGTVFEVTKTGGVYATTPTVLTSFSSGVTASGSGNLVEDAAGDLFGTTTSSVFEVVKTASGYATPVSLIPSFPVGTEIGNLTIDAGGDIFGTTISGGANDDGSVFEIVKTPTGYASTATTLASFTPADGKLTLGRTKTLLLDANGDLFGTTDPSSANPGGVVYEIVKTSAGYDPTPAIVISGTANAGFGANLVADASGDLFTTTKAGGANSTGAALEITGSGFVAPKSTDLYWHNTSTGKASIWEMEGNVRVGGGAVSPSPAPIWTEIGTGDFFDNGDADILWQNASTGQASIWEMNGTTRVGGGPVNVNAGPNWQAVGTGDFTGDGFSDDILWRNTVTGQTSIWEMSGTTRSGGGAVANSPGTGWKAVGTGDFNHDGHSDILWQNTATGQISIWDMNGNTRIAGGGAVANNPGPDWQAIGTGDFGASGFADDIVFQNKTTGQVSIWDMQDNTRVGGGKINSNLGTSWHAIGTDGGSDLLLQSTSGQATIWDISGTTIASGGAVSVNPGTSWRAVGLA